MYRRERDGESAHFFPIERASERASERSADNVLVALDANLLVENDECCHDWQNYIMLCKGGACEFGFRFCTRTFARNDPANCFVPNSPRSCSRGRSGSL